MTGLLRKAGLAGVIAATALTSAAPAEAQRHWRHRDRNGDAATGALIGGVIGLGLGAAVSLLTFLQGFGYGMVLVRHGQEHSA